MCLGRSADVSTLWLFSTSIVRGLIAEVGLVPAEKAQNLFPAMSRSIASAKIERAEFPVQIKSTFGIFASRVRGFRLSRRRSGAQGS